MSLIISRRNLLLQAGCAMVRRVAAPGLLLLTILAAPAEDWPQWRGPNRDGSWNEAGNIESVPPGGLEICWRARIGPGYSSPVAAHGQVYVTDSQIQGQKAFERVLCFDAQTGKPLWIHRYEVDYAEWAFDPKNAFGPRPTPVIKDNRIFTVGARGRLLCLDCRSGKVVWKKDFANKPKDSTLTPSPLIEGNLLILVLDGLPPGPCVIALKKNSGKEVWKALDESATFGSPVVLTAAGKRQLIVWTQGFLTSLDPATGKPYWRQRHPGGATYAVPTPVARAGLLLVNGVMYKLDSEKPGASLLWPERAPVSRRTVSETSTASFIGDHVYASNLAGELICMEAMTGRILWGTHQVTDATSGGSIHITPNGNSAFLFNDKGELISARLSAGGYAETGRAALLQPTSTFGPRKMAWVPPAYSNGHVFARSDEELVCASLGAKP